MCIRDSVTINQAAVKNPATLVRLAGLASHMANAISNSPATMMIRVRMPGSPRLVVWPVCQSLEARASRPVSYTHLDVYKRQVVDFPLADHNNLSLDPRYGRSLQDFLR